jgi:hypothetical protein
MEVIAVRYPTIEHRTYRPGSKGLNKHYKAHREQYYGHKGILQTSFKSHHNPSVGQYTDQRGLPTFAYKIPNGKIYKTAPQMDKIPRGGNVPRVVGSLGEEFQNIKQLGPGAETDMTGKTKLIDRQVLEAESGNQGSANPAAAGPGGPQLILVQPALNNDISKLDEEFTHPPPPPESESVRVQDSNLKNESISYVRQAGNAALGLISYAGAHAADAFIEGAVGSLLGPFHAAGSIGGRIISNAASQAARQAVAEGSELAQRGFHTAREGLNALNPVTNATNFAQQVIQKLKKRQNQGPTMRYAGPPGDFEQPYERNIRRRVSEAGESFSPILHGDRINPPTKNFISNPGAIGKMLATNDESTSIPDTTFDNTQSFIEEPKSKPEKEQPKKERRTTNEIFKGKAGTLAEIIEKFKKYGIEIPPKKHGENTNKYRERLKSEFVSKR